MSQINGCSLCVDMHARELKEAGEKELSSLLVSIAAINVFNRLNAAVRQPAGSAW